MSQQIRGKGCHLIFPFCLKNRNLVEDVEILLPVKFRWIPISGFEDEVENGSANQWPGRPSCFSGRPEKHKLGKGRCDLATRQVSLNSNQRFWRRSPKCLSQSEARVVILVFPIDPKNTNLVEDIVILLPVKFRWIPFRGFREEVERTDDGQRVITIVHLRFRFRCTKNRNNLFQQKFILSNLVSLPFLWHIPVF